MASRVGFGSVVLMSDSDPFFMSYPDPVILRWDPDPVILRWDPDPGYFLRSDPDSGFLQVGTGSGFFFRGRI